MIGFVCVCVAMLMQKRLCRCTPRDRHLEARVEQEEGAGVLGRERLGKQPAGHDLIAHEALEAVPVGVVERCVDTAQIVELAAARAERHVRRLGHVVEPGAR